MLCLSQDAGLSHPDARQGHRKTGALSKHWCAEVNTGLNQLHVSTVCSPHLTQLNVAQTLRKEVTASSTAKKLHFSNTTA